MAATSFSFINGSPNCDHRAGYLVFERPWWREAAGGHCDYRRLIKLIRTPANKSALPSPALTTRQAGRSMEATKGAIVMDNADSSLNLRTFVPSPRDLGQAAAR